MSPYMALTARKGHAASVRRQSRQRLRSERRYRRNRSVRFYRHLVRTGSAFPRLPRRFAGRNDKLGGHCLFNIGPHFPPVQHRARLSPPLQSTAGGLLIIHSSFFSLQDSFISVPLPHNTRLTALQNFPLSIFDFPRSPILFFSVFLYKYFRIESAKIRKKINKVRKYP